MFSSAKPRFRKTEKTHSIGAFIKQKRIELGVTQLDLAKMVGVGFNFIRELEQGKQSVRMDKLSLILNFFGYEVSVAPMKRESTSKSTNNKEAK